MQYVHTFVIIHLKSGSGDSIHDTSRQFLIYNAANGSFRNRGNLVRLAKYETKKKQRGKGGGDVGCKLTRQERFET